MLVVVCGWPLSGKGTIASKLSGKTGFPHLDIDENIRLPIFGRPHPRPNESDELMKRDVEEMAASYDLLLHATQIHIDLKRPLIVSASFSRRKGQDDLIRLTERNPATKLRIIWCHPTDDTAEEIARRLARRSAQGAYSGSVTTPERYQEVKGRFEPITLPHLDLDTSSSAKIESCLDIALQYIEL